MIALCCFAGWFEKFPEPPLGILARLDALLSFHDAPLASHMRASFQGGVASVAWGIMQELLAGVLPQTDWLKVMLLLIHSAYRSTAEPVPILMGLTSNVMAQLLVSYFVL